MQDIMIKIFEILVYVAIGVLFCIGGYFILAKNKHYNLNEEIDNHNKAAGIMVAGYFIAIAIIMSGVL
ncbi:DUF350 domain-containing protein [Acetivibrio cellulolyticus]|uniref:DUF350 domain-containing protein n=1 Tax=Acetivibrio cellulolyticus TaxID=35830 RepID=UPI0001E3014A|nr:DUF350 domain-containing protein [Acetivibrio cellulolyticus]